MLDEIGKIFGTRILQVVIGVTALYYALVALARVKELYFDSDAARAARARKWHLENLKLEAEIAAARHSAGLPMLVPEELIPVAQPARMSPLRRAAASLWSYGSIGKFFFVILTVIFQLFGWLATGVLILAARFWIANRLQDPKFLLTSVQGYSAVAALLLGGGALYLGFGVFGGRLRKEALLQYRVLCSGVALLAAGFFVMLWLLQKPIAST